MGENHHRQDLKQKYADTALPDATLKWALFLLCTAGITSAKKLCFGDGKIPAGPI